ncbi:MAG TPA: hypothetical protein VGE06_03825, partial [Flavisolibacter sp.]
SATLPTILKRALARRRKGEWSVVDGEYNLHIQLTPRYTSFKYDLNNINNAITESNQKKSKDQIRAVGRIGRR